MDVSQSHRSLFTMGKCSGSSRRKIISSVTFSMRALIAALVILTVVAARSAPAAAGGQVALVIGNSSYRHTPALANPKNDADDVSAVLKSLGFLVIDGVDLDKAAFERKIVDFATALSGAEAGVFFYAGHGLQFAGQNYLVPIDAELTMASALELELVRLDALLDIMKRGARTTNILFLDACRYNPLSRNLARAMGSRSTEIGSGLASMQIRVGVDIAFSTTPGDEAVDGSGRNSPFTGALVKHLAQPHADVSLMLSAVRNDVAKETNRKQIPWDMSTRVGPFSFQLQPR